MAICKWCKSSGTFLKVSDIGLCLSCDNDIVNNIRFNACKIKEALNSLEYYDSIENAIENFIEILKYAKPLSEYENKGIKTEDLFPSALLNTYTNKLSWMKDLKKNGYKVYRSFCCNATETLQINENRSSRQQILGRCGAGDKLFPVAVPEGKIEAAMKLMTKENKQIGCLSQRVVAEFHNLINDDDFEFDVEISKITTIIDWDTGNNAKGCYVRFTCFQR